MFWEIASSKSSFGPLHSMTQSGMPFTKRTMSGRRVLVEPERSTSNSLQTWKVLLAGLTQSMYFSDRQAPEFQRQIISSAVDLGPQNL
jgi:hypothetical protein